MSAVMVHVSHAYKNMDMARERTPESKIRKKKTLFFENYIFDGGIPSYRLVVLSTPFAFFCYLVRAGDGDLVTLGWPRDCGGEYLGIEGEKEYRRGVRGWCWHCVCQWSWPDGYHCAFG